MGDAGDGGGGGSRWSGWECLPARWRFQLMICMYGLYDRNFFSHTEFLLLASSLERERDGDSP